MSKALEREMNNYFTQLNEDEKKSVIQMLKAFLKGKKAGTKRISIEQYNIELKKAEQQIEEGNFITQEDLEKEMKEW